MKLSFDTVLCFLEDEGLGPFKTKNEESDEWQISIHEPAQFGTNDSKWRCGITNREVEGELRTVFNCFKAASTDDRYKGDFVNFVRLIKDLDTYKAARFYILKNYLKLNNISPRLQQQKSMLDPSMIELPQGTIKFEHAKHNAYYKYLRSRGLSPDKIKSLKLFINKMSERIIFPVYENNNLVFYNGRSINKKHPMPWLKAKAPNSHAIYNLENVNGSSVSIFEGILDSYYINNGVALGGIGTEVQLKKILDKKYNKIVVVMDNDEAGIKAKFKIAEWFIEKGHQNIWIFNYFGVAFKDFGEILEANLDIKFEERLYKYTDLRTKVLIRGSYFK